VAEGEWLRRGDLLELAPQRAGPSRGQPARGQPSGSVAGVLEFIGGSYLATTPQISYRRLLEALSTRGWLLRAWSYVPGFDHQSQANEAWRAFRRAREESPPPEGAPLLRLGHSLGCKLHLLAPDNGRACSGLVALSFNNFSAERSVPLLGELGQQFGFRSEFSPSPSETLRLVGRSYRQPRNLLVRFRGDGLDQSRRLHAVLQERPEDATTLLDLPGDHLTPASAGLRKQLLGDWADDPSRQRQIDRLAETICGWSQSAGS
jgi:hypothetical protein